MGYSESYLGLPEVNSKSKYVSPPIGCTNSNMVGRERSKNQFSHNNLGKEHVFKIFKVSNSKYQIYQLNYFIYGF